MTFDEIVLAIRGGHPEIPLAMAERAARRELGMPESSAVHPDFARTEVLNAQLLDDALEDAHVDAGDKLVRALGGHVVRNSQKRASKVTPGVPDRIYFFPAHRVATFWEAKRIGGKQSSAQVLFQELCIASSWSYLAGPLSALEAFIVRTGIARNEIDGTWTPLPFHPLLDI